MVPDSSRKPPQLANSAWLFSATQDPFPKPSQHGTMPQFNPNNYGNPVARKNLNQNPSQTQPTPDWGFEQHRPSNDNAGANSSRSTTHADAVKEISLSSDGKADASSLTHRATAQETVFKIPGFNPQAYGHPGKTGLTKGRPSVPKEATQQGAPQLRPGPELGVDDKVAPQPPAPEQAEQSNQTSQASKSLTVETPHDDGATSAEVQATSTSSDLKDIGVASTLAEKSPSVASVSNVKGNTQDAIHQHANASCQEAVTNTPPQHEQCNRPPVYESLKKEGETPMDTLRRLQAAKQMEVMINNHKRSDIRALNTANLAELKNLRRPLSPELATPTPTVTSTTSAMNISSRAPLLPPSHTAPIIPDPPTPKTPTPVSIQHSTLIPPALATVNPNITRRPSPLSRDPLNVNDIVKPQDDTNLRTSTRLQSQQKPSQRHNWATKSEVKTPAWGVDSNAAGSVITQEDGSLSHMGLDTDLGRLVRRRQQEVGESAIIGWDGNWMPPPVDWEQRPRFANNKADFKDGFRRWLGETVKHTLTSDAVPKLQFQTVPSDAVTELSLHPDGLGFVTRDTTINLDNGQHYGYNLRNDTFLRDDSEVADFDGNCEVDLSLPTNLPYREETAHKLMTRKILDVQRDLQRDQAYLEESRVAQQAMATAAVEYVPYHPPRPKVNLYLRPAVSSDIPGMKAILNWHIENGVRTSELTAISDLDMQIRMDMVKQSKLPFIVAIERGRRKARPKDSHNSPNPGHPIHNTNPGYSGVIKDEHVIGWASATDWSASDYVECISADLELYVAHDYRKKGVGRCLMDALLEATDRGYMKKGGYDFTVAPEIQHLYNTGGGRDLHKIIFQLRTYSNPQTPEQKHSINTYSNGYQNTINGNTRDRLAATPAPDFSKEAKLNDREDDYQVWLKEWLESFGFKEEATIKQMGTKNRRFLDSRYLTRETHWQPVEKKDLTDYAQHPV